MKVSTHTLALTLLTLALTTLPHATALHFILGSSEKCFHEDLDKDTLVVGHYDVRNMGDATANHDDVAKYGREQPGRGMELAITVSVRDPGGRVLFAQKGDESHRFAFTSHVEGVHTVCIRPTTAGSWFSGSRDIRVDFSLDKGEMALDFKEIARVEHLSEIEGSVFKLRSMVNDISATQAHFRRREERFRDTTAATHSQALFWSLVQIGVMVASSAAQMYFFKSSFASSRRFFLGW